MKNAYYLGLGILFGVTLVRSQVVSWYRIQEMFLFDNFHMYGVIGTAIITASLSLFILKKSKITALDNSPISIVAKNLNRGTIFGGVLFGLGWSLIGACPGPLYVLVGNGATIYILGILGALAGVIVFGYTIGAVKR